MRRAIQAISVATVLGIAAGAAAPAFADDAVASPDEYAVSKSEAKQIATQYLRSLGFTRALESSLTARITGIERQGDTWHVSVLYGNHLPNKRGKVTVDAKTGAINGG